MLELAYGTGYQNGDGEQAAVWEIAYRRLTEGVYASLAAQTHLSGDYALIDWRVNAGINEEIGQLEALTAVFKQRLADAMTADAAASLSAGNAVTTASDAVRTNINEFGRILRGLDLTRSSTCFAFREAFTVEAPAGLDGLAGLAANDAALRTFAFDTAGISTSAYNVKWRDTIGACCATDATLFDGGLTRHGFKMARRFGLCHQHARHRDGRFRRCSPRGIQSSVRFVNNTFGATTFWKGGEYGAKNR